MKGSFSSSSRLRLWEAALFLALGLTLTAGVWASATEAALADRVLRLHVVANSDSDADQARKLLVRDAVLARAVRLLDGASGRQDAEAALAPHLDELAQAGAEALARTGNHDPVRVELDGQWFPTREYDGFSLPAGRYRALRVTIGAGAGRNWWCVVFPALCLPAAGEEDPLALLPEGQREAAQSQYKVGFKLAEWFEEFKHWLG